MGLRAVLGNGANAGRVVREDKSVAWGGYLSLELLDSHGLALVSTSGHLGEFSWGTYWELDDQDVMEFSKMPASRFNPDPKEQYVVHVSYLPDPQLKNRKGFVYIRSGGRK